MKKDIFIDNNIAIYFSNPIDPEYLKLLGWLLETRDKKKQDCAFLAVSKKIIVEYYSSSGYSKSNTSIVVILSELTKQGRINNITSEQIKNFKRQYYKKSLIKKLRCNNKDRNHIPVVLLSDRKFALSKDKNFVYDLRNFPSFKVVVEDSPEKMQYRS